MRSTGEDMSREVADRCLEVLAATDIPTVDITGGAPEMAAQFRHLVRGARALGWHVMDRCNLSILLAKPYADLVDFLAEHEVEVVASLPHYRQHGTDRQRGDGFDASIGRPAAERGGLRPRSTPAPGARHEPVGAFLAPGQTSLEAEWKRELKRLHGVDFDALYALNNMPISRYLEWLEAGGQTGVHAPSRGRVQPGRRGRGDVPDHPLGRLGRAALRLRLQSDARSGGRKVLPGTSMTSISAGSRRAGS